MSKSKKYILGLALAGISCFYLSASYIWKDGQDVKTDKKNLSNPDIGINRSIATGKSLPGKDQKLLAPMAHSRRYPLLSRDHFRKKTIEDPFASFPKEPLGKSQYMYVKGLEASFKKPAGGNYKLISGIYYFESSDENTDVIVIFDKKYDQYGLWSKEIIVNSDLLTAEKIASDYEFKLIHSSGNSHILSAVGHNDYVELIQRLDSISSVYDMRLDLRFGRAIRQ